MDGDDSERPDDDYDPAITLIAVILIVASLTLACLISWPR